MPCLLAAVLYSRNLQTGKITFPPAEVPAGVSFIFFTYCFDALGKFYDQATIEINQNITSTTTDRKLRYIHNHSVTAGLCNYPEEHYYSSSKFYEMG